jgi:hypothetical protein
MARAKLASAMPITGASVTSRAAYRPGSPKQATIAASKLPSRSATQRTTPAAASASS